MSRIMILGVTAEVAGRRVRVPRENYLVNFAQND
jgi:hypothetical protein